MVYKKSSEEIRIIREGGLILARILKEMVAEVKPGVSTLALENILVKRIKEAGGRPAFKDYDMGGGIFFPSALCASINEEVVHGTAIPGRLLKSGDIIDLDIGMEWPVDPKVRAVVKAPVNKFSADGGYFTDMCTTVAVGKISAAAKKLLKVTKECLMAGINQAKPGNTLNDIGSAVQFIAETHGYGVVRDLVGHGVGYLAHEDPNVFNYSIPPRSSENLVLEVGMVIAIEPMINAGTWKVKTAKNDYTILTADNSLSAHFEHTVAITEHGPEILTK
ncbi:MAG: type I methionyl aminopeptidase [Candidatus Falkowbacteria bacterium]